MPKNNRTVTLARVSSKTQEDGYSLDSQQKTIRKYCTDKNLKVIKEFRLSETASKNERRKVFQEMLGYLKKNNAMNLVVEKTDRLTRNFRDAVVVDDWLEGDEFRRLHMVKESLEIHKYARSDTKLMWNIYLSFAKKYTDNLREEAMKGWDEKLAQGWTPASPPHGYKTIKQDGKRIHVLDEERAFIVERAFSLYSMPGQNVETAAQELTASGLTTSRGRPLTKSAVYKMLRNKYYIGTIQFAGKEYPGAQEPLLTKELFDAVQDKLSHGRATKKRVHDPVLKGVMRCKSCKAMVTWSLQKGYYYGACQRRNDVCRKYPFIRHDRVEDQVIRSIELVDAQDKKQLKFMRLMSALNAMREPYVGSHRKMVTKHLRQQQTRLERMIDNLYEDKIAGVMDEQKYTTRATQLQDDITIIEYRLKKIEAVEPKTSNIIEPPKSICELYERESKVGKRMIIAEVLTINFQAGAAQVYPR